MLKHQLKKYVAAVQMLNKDGSSAHQIIADLTPALNHFVQDEEMRKVMIQQQQEASQYEHKLVQVISISLNLGYSWEIFFVPIIESNFPLGCSIVCLNFS
jgi:hypothetical protein